MLIVKVTGRPDFTVSGSTVKATVPVAAYDYAGTNDAWKVGETTLTITGTTSDTLATFKAALLNAVAAWKQSLTALEALKAKLDKIEGLEM